MNISIAYCAECGFGPLAVRVAEALLETYEHAGVGQITIEVGGKGIFEVRADGDLIAERKDKGRLPEPGEVVASIGVLLA